MSARLAWLRQSWQRLRELARVNIWDVEISAIPRPGRAAVRTLRVLHLIIRGFLEDECPLHASALTFSTMMSIVPILALCLALLRGFGGEHLARERLRGAVQEWTRSFAAQVDTPPSAVPAPAGKTPENAHVPDKPPPVEDEWTADHLGAEIEQAVDRAFDKVEKINFAALGVLGLGILLLTTTMVLGRVESAFNRVWGVKAGRTLIRKFTDYLSAILVLPFLLVVATSLPVVDIASSLLAPDAAVLLQTVAASPVVRHGTVLLTLTILFTFLIKFMPNTQVRLAPAAWGGLCAAVLFIGWMAACAALQVGVARYGRLYGSFALAPILLAWVHVSWEIILLSAEVAFALQNAATYRVEQGAEHASIETRLTLGLVVLADAARGLSAGAGAFDVGRFAAEHRIPVRLLNAVIGQLTRTGFLGELGEPPGRYALLCAPNTCRASDVQRALLAEGVGPGELGLRPVPPAVRAAVEKMWRRDPAADPVLADLARAAAPPGSP